MPDIQYHQITNEFTAANQVNDLDLLTMQQQSTGILFKIKKSILALVVLGGRAIVGSGSILTTDGQSTVSNKRYNSPKFNSDSTTSFTSADADKVTGLQCTKQDLDRTAGLQANAQTQITALGTSVSGLLSDNQDIHTELDTINNNTITDLDVRVGDLETVTANLADIRLYTLEFTASATSESIAEATIKYALDNTNKKVSIASVVQVYDLDGTKMTEVTGIQITRQTTSGVVHLDNIGITTVTGHTYYVAVNARLI